ncbi:MAG: LysR family transcriptional regulator [Stackebrandtia sp.]
MDLDLSQVRAFVTAAETLHFTRAAEQLAITQQSLSKRIARLESHLGVSLFTRRTRSVALTEAGRAFLRPARKALEAGREAAAVVTGRHRRLRVDVWGHLYQPARTLGPAVRLLPTDTVELGMCRDRNAAAASLTRGEIDAGFGRVPAHPDADLASEIVRLEPLDAVLSAGHPLSDRPQLRPGDLRDSRMWFPSAASRLDFLSRFCAHFGVPAESGDVNLGVEHLIQALAADANRVTLFPADASLPVDPRVRVVPIVDPTPLYAWSLLWSRHPGTGRPAELLRVLAETGRARRWREFDPARDWLPETDQDKPAESRRPGRLS